MPSCFSSSSSLTGKGVLGGAGSNMRRFALIVTNRRLRGGILKSGFKVLSLINWTIVACMSSGGSEGEGSDGGRRTFLTRFNVFANHDRKVGGAVVDELLILLLI